MEFLSLSKTADKSMLYLRSADAIKSFIRNSGLKIGDKLPGERVLSEKLQISRNSVREGLRLLETQGVIQVRTGVGSFVERGIENETMVFQLISNNFAELLEIKSILERFVISKLSIDANVEQKATLQQMVSEMQASVDRGKYPQQQDHEFHRYLVACQNNAVLQEMLNEVINSLDGYWAQVKQDVSKLNATIPLHVKMVECLCAGDADGALSAYDAICEIDIQVMNKNGDRIK